ncbi:hypothetical protein [Loigolactobacillus backii]|uniref:hypothetical protein n=1 Tax=Loigolactobacillus backii TaxID=375175 RepID=UPI000ABCDDA2|nr:hypothetical protein [Loigolactobacillus backii]
MTNDVKVMASKYFLRMSTEMLSDFLDFNGGPILPLNSGSEEDFQLSLSMYQSHVKGMSLMYGVIDDQLAKELDDFTGKLIDLAKESICARTASPKEGQDDLDVEDELEDKLADIRHRAIKLQQQVHAQIEALA